MLSRTLHVDDHLPEPKALASNCTYLRQTPSLEHLERFLDNHSHQQQRDSIDTGFEACLPWTNRRTVSSKKVSSPLRRAGRISAPSVNIQTDNMACGKAPNYQFKHSKLGNIVGLARGPNSEVVQFRGIPFASIPARFRQSVVVKKLPSQPFDARRPGFAEPALKQMLI
jgi:hypothetical protein